MMNFVLNAIVVAALIGTFLLAPAPPPQSAASRPAEPAVASSAVDDTAAKAVIEASGYREVSGLTRTGDGTWRAKAYIGTAEVRLMVDARGKVVPE